MTKSRRVIWFSVLTAIIVISSKICGCEKLKLNPPNTRQTNTGRLDHLEDCELPQSVYSLEELADLYKPSKFTFLNTRFQYAYPIWLEEYRAKKFRMLEIGLGSGQGSLLWKEYFPCAELYGLEHSHLNAKTSGGASIHTIVGDQGDYEFLNGRLIQQTGGAFDVIIDDGGHHYEQQRASYEVLFLKALNPGGIYIIEDIETSYWKKGELLYGRKISRGPESMETIVNLFKSIVDVINKKFYDNDYKVIGEADQWISMMTFGSNYVALVKKNIKDCFRENVYGWPGRLHSMKAKTQTDKNLLLRTFCKNLQ